jgi:cytochrome c oxidase subunit 4
MSEHVVPTRVYVAVFAALMALTLITVWASGQDFGPFNTVVALMIAITKATLVVLFFMHVKYGTRLVKLIVAGSLVWLAILIVVTLSDYASRGWLARADAGRGQSGFVIEDR